MLNTYKIEYSSQKALIPPIKACPLVKIIKVVATILGISDYEIKEIGMRPGEKIDEVLITQHEIGSHSSKTAPKYTLEELKDLLTSYLYNNAPDLLKNTALQMDSGEVTH
jgi:FlaA1/EpsC-like NDP-sugar epimerase